MCAVSMIYDYYRDPFRQPYDTRPPRPIPMPAPPMPWEEKVPSSLPWTRDALADLKEILKRLDTLDKKLGLEHCEDPKKAEWMQQIEERLKRLEDAAHA